MFCEIDFDIIQFYKDAPYSLIVLTIYSITNTIIILEHL